MPIFAHYVVSGIICQYYSSVIAIYYNNGVTFIEYNERYTIYLWQTFKSDDFPPRYFTLAMPPRAAVSIVLYAVCSCRELPASLGGDRRIPTRTPSMTTRSPSPSAGHANGTAASALERTYRRFDLLFSLDPLNEAIAIAQEAVAGSSRILNALPPDASAEQIREKWARENLFLGALLRLASDRATAVLAAANYLTIQMDDR
jgi:hypothetical protein